MGTRDKRTTERSTKKTAAKTRTKAASKRNGAEAATKAPTQKKRDGNGTSDVPKRTRDTHGNGATSVLDPSRNLAPIKAHVRREDGEVDARLAEIDEVCTAWADIVAERMAADQTFADLVEQYHLQPPRDLRAMFLWDALQAASAHVSVITEVLARHLRRRLADPVKILDDLRAYQRRIAAVYAVNAFLAVLNQMKPEKPKWLSADGDLDQRFAVLALAHQTLSYALEAGRISAPPDFTEQIIQATQDEAVWVWRRMPEPGTDTLAACAAAAAFFRELGASAMSSTEDVAALYAAHRETQPS